MWIINNIEKIFIGIKAFLQSENIGIVITGLLALVFIGKWLYKKLFK